MIQKMVTWTIFICLCIAIPLAIMGYHRVELGEPFLALISTTNRDLAQVSFKIPDIPSIPLFDAPQGILIVINFLIKVVNGLSALLNFIILVLNYLIQLIMFVVILLKNLITFKDSVQPYISMP